MNDYDRLKSQLLDGKAWRDRLAAARSLGNIADGKVLVPLGRALQDPYWQVREEAVLSLGKIGGRKTTEVLTRALADEVLSVRWAALEALEVVAAMIKPETFAKIVAAPPDPLGLLRQWTEEIVDEKGFAILYDLFEAKDKKIRDSKYFKAVVAKKQAAAKASLALEKLQPYCRTCLRRFAGHKVKTGLFSSTSFFCCSQCWHTKNRIEGIATVVAVLDAPWAETQYREDGTLYVNMVMREKNKKYLVDFEVLEIRATPDQNLNEELKFLLMRSTEDGIMNPAKMKTIPARLVNNPSLNQNSLNLLEFRLKETIGEPAELPKCY